jgi:hypothetical protein
MRLRVAEKRQRVTEIKRQRLGKERGLETNGDKEMREQRGEKHTKKD